MYVFPFNNKCQKLHVTLLFHCPHQAQLLEAKKELETQNTLQQKTRELLRTSEQQVAALKALLASASSPEVVLTTPSISATGLRPPLKGKQQGKP